MPFEKDLRTQLMHINISSSFKWEHMIDITCLPTMLLYCHLEDFLAEMVMIGKIRPQDQLLWQWIG